MNLRPERLAGGAGGTVPVDAVFLEPIVRGEIETTTEPPHRFGIVPRGGEETDVGVGGGHVGIARMNHQRHAHGFETAPGQLRPLGGGRRRQAGTGDVGKVDAGLFEQRTVTQHAGATAAGQTAAAGGALPGIFPERRGAVGRFQGTSQPILQFAQITQYGVDIGRFGHGDSTGSQCVSHRLGG